MSLALYAGGVAIGFNTGMDVKATAHPGGNIAWAITFLTLLKGNALSLLFVYSGVATLGLSTVVGWTFISIFIGATWDASVRALGLSGVLGITIWYAPFEFGALGLAAAAGLLPITSSLLRVFRRKHERTELLKTYLEGMTRSTKWLGLALALLTLAAAIEATVITTNH